jgi:hypothetical protein
VLSSSELHEPAPRLFEWHQAKAYGKAVDPLIIDVHIHRFPSGAQWSARTDDREVGCDQKAGRVGPSETERKSIEGSGAARGQHRYVAQSMPSPATVARLAMMP